MSEKEKKETTKTTRKTKKETNEQNKKKTYCYIGPNIPNGSLKQNAILLGSRKEIKQRYNSEIEEYPQIERLIVPIEKLSESKEKIKTTGNVVNKYYQDLAFSINTIDKKGV